MPRNHYQRIRKHIEKDAALERRFASHGRRADQEEAIDVLRGVTGTKAHHKVKITDESIEAAVRIILPVTLETRFLPDKAIDLIEAFRVRLRAFTTPDRSWKKELEPDPYGQRPGL